MTWMAAAVTAVATVVVLWGPGLVVLRAWGWRHGVVAAVAVAPSVTLGVLAATAVVTEGVVPWGAPVAVVAVAVVAAGGLLLRRTGRPAAVPVPWWTAVRTGPAGLLVAVVAGVAAQLVPLAVGMRRADAYLTAHDTAYHLAALAWIRATGRASSLHLTAAADASDGGTFYGAAWHDAAALVPRWPDPAVVADVVTLVPAALAWTTGLLFLTRVVVPHRPRAHVWAPLLGSAGVALPVLLTLRPEGMAPNATGLALAPALVALLALRVERPWRTTVPVVALSVVGVALTHPNALLTVAVAAGPLLVGRAWARLRTVSRTAAVAAAGGVLALAVAAAVLVSRTPQFGNVTGFAAEGPRPLPDALVAVLSGNATGMGWAAGGVVMAGALVGVVVGRRLPGRWAWYGLAAVVVLFLCATSSVPFVTDVDRLWYGEPRRFAPMIGAMAVPPAALAADAMARRLRAVAVRERRPAWVGVGLVGALVAASAVSASLGLTALAARTSWPQAGSPALADAAELDLARRLDASLPTGAVVLGSPYSGVVNLAERSGVRVVPPTQVAPRDPDVAFVGAHVEDLGSDPRVCAALDRLEVTHLYVDTAPWNTEGAVVDLRAAPPAGVRLVDRGGSAAVYEVVGC